MSEPSPAVAANDRQTAPASGGMMAQLTPGQRSMFMVVVVLGIFLVLGLMALIVAVIVRVSAGSSETAEPGRPLITENLILPKDGDIRRLWTDDSGRLVVQTADPVGHGEIVVYDLRKGSVVARIAVK